MSRLKKYIDIKEIIKRECNEFLKECNGKYFYRGVKKNIKKIEFVIPRTNRKPSEIPLEVHNILNEKFNKKFGWKCRNGVFVSADEEIAGSYGSCYMFFPVDGYKYVWSPIVEDLWFNLNGKDYISNTKRNCRYKGELKTKWLIKREKWLIKIVDSYTNKGIKDIDKEELIVKCKGYYLVNPWEYNE